MNALNFHGSDPSYHEARRRFVFKELSVDEKPHRAKGRSDRGMQPEVACKTRAGTSH